MLVTHVFIYHSHCYALKVHFLVDMNPKERKRETQSSLNIIDFMISFTCQKFDRFLARLLNHIITQIT